VYWRRNRLAVGCWASRCLAVGGRASDGLLSRLVGTSVHDVGLSASNSLSASCRSIVEIIVPSQMLIQLVEDAIILRGILVTLFEYAYK